jgi:hypothetical protein
MTLISLLCVGGNAYIHAQVALKTARRAASESCMCKECSAGGWVLELIVLQDIKTEVLVNDCKRDKGMR